MAKIGRARMTPEQIDLESRAKRRHWATMTPEQREARMKGARVARWGGKTRKLQAGRKKKRPTRRPQTAETRARISAAMKGVAKSEEARAKMSVAQTGRWRSPETRAKTLATHLKDGHAALDFGVGEDKEGC